MLKEKNNLLIIGLFEPCTGLGNVMSALITHLSGAYHISALGFQPGLCEKSYDTKVAGHPMRVCRLNARVFLPERGWLENHLLTVGADAILIIGPLMLIERLLAGLQPYRSGTKIVLYLPVEGTLTNPGALHTISLVDHCILYTQYACRDVKNLYTNAVNIKTLPMPELSVIGHGLDCSRFFPFRPKSSEKRGDLRRLLLPEKPELVNAFIVLNANRYYYRKRIDLSVNGFAIFAAKRQDAYLILHTGKLSDNEADELQKCISCSGVADQILLNPLTKPNEKLSEKQLNLFYNMCDVGLTTAMGEGWGLTAFEHAATGAPQIMPDHSSFSENWLGGAVFIPTGAMEHVFYEYADMFTVEPVEVAFALTSLYDDPLKYQEMALAALFKSHDTGLEWPNVAKKFHAVLDSVLKGGYRHHANGIFQKTNCLHSNAEA